LPEYKAEEERVLQETPDKVDAALRERVDVLRGDDAAQT
jgi:hypothetical protein